MTFTVHQASFRYPGRAERALRDVTLSFSKGVHTAIVGPNGAGKSTLLRLLLGRLRPDSGQVAFDDRRATHWPRRELARRVGALLQSRETYVPLTVRELVEMGRHPYLKPWASLTTSDWSIVSEALASVDLSGFEDRDVSRLSGGELQRARLGRALAQRPEWLLLDEPTAHLDLGHEIQWFELISELVTTKHLTVITVTHNINLAFRFADRMVLISEGRVVAEGTPADVVTEENLTAAFRWPIAVREVPGLGWQAIPTAARQRVPR